MIDYPKISIVTPNFNYGHFLEQTILSVINQDYPNLEYIIIDGGSTDNSIEIIKKYEHHLAYWVSEPDKGMYDAVNKGFKKSTGEIMAWLNSDDMYFPWAFKVVAEVLSEFKEIKWVSTLQGGAIDYNGYVMEFEKLEGFDRKAFLEGCYAGLNYSSKFIQQESTFWKRNLWNSAGGFVSTEASMAGDFELWQRFYERENLYGIVSPLASFRYQFAQQSSAKQQYVSHCSAILKKTVHTRSFASALRKIIKRVHIDRLPVFSRIVKMILGYDGLYVIRNERTLPQSHWSISKHKFI